MSRRLQHVLRRGDVLFRYGGDEFIAASSAPDLEARLREVFSKPVQTQTVPLRIEARIGVQRRSGAIDIDAVVHEADRRMYAERATVSPQQEPQDKLEAQARPGSPTEVWINGKKRPSENKGL